MELTTKLKREHEKIIKSLDLIREYPKETIINNSQIVVTLCEDIANQEKEVFGVFCLNTKNKVIKREIISIGILDASIIHPREVFRPAILNNSSKIILIHNHPSGDSMPSSEDLEITRKLKEAGEQLGIKIIDHLIVTKDKNKFWSYTG